MAYAELTDVRSYYELIGEGEPLLFIPGLGGTCRVWDPIVPELAAHFSLILVDNRGIGRSVARRKPRSLADYSSDLVELLDELQLDRAHVLGLSLGGIIAQRFAMDHPSRVDRLVLVSCAHRFSAYLLRMAALLGHSLRRFPRAVFVQTMELLATAPLYMDAHIDEIELAMKERCREGLHARAMGTQLRCLLKSEVDPADYRITVPTLVIAGEHDALIPNCYARLMAQRIPASRFLLIPGAGHNPMVEVPEKVLPLIEQFLHGMEVGTATQEAAKDEPEPRRR